jgi:DNA-binding MarR family transcriptional regulator
MAGLRKGGFLLAKVHQLAGRVFTRFLKERDLDAINPAQGRILFVLWEAGEIPIHELAKRTSLGKSTLSSMLDRLETGGYVQRRMALKDRRTVLVCSTKKDEIFRKAFVAVSKQMTELWYRGLSEADRDHFEKTLKHILANLESAEQDQK